MKIEKYFELAIKMTERRNLENLWKQEELMERTVSQIKTQDKRRFWYEKFEEQADKSPVGFYSYKFFKRVAELIDCEIGLVEIFGEGYETNPDFLAIQDL